MEVTESLEQRLAQKQIVNMGRLKESKIKI